MLETKTTAKLLWSALLLLLGSGWAGPAAGQDQRPQQRYTLAVRGIALDEALERFARVTGLALAYDPALVRGHEAYCAAENEPAEHVLHCILHESGLDFYRLSSGTYVLTPRAELPPRLGYLAGLVTDRATGAPLADAHVYLEEVGLGSATNEAGRFVFPALLPGRYAVRITHLGYHAWQDTLHIAAREQIHAEAALQAETIFITPVVVDGLHERTSAEGLGRERVEAGEALAGRPAGADAAYRRLGTLAGVRMSHVTADVHVQGGDAGEHELRLDGAPVYLPRSVTGIVGPFSAFALDRLVVHKAGFEAARGSQTSGVVLAEHALGSDDRAGGKADVQVDLFSANARVQLAPRLASGASALAVMAAARLGLWDLYAPDPVRATLDAWSAPDPFLIVAPPMTETNVAPSDAFTLAGLSGRTDPSLHFSDVHAAARLRLGPLRTLYASAYQGRNRLTGGLLSGPQRAVEQDALTSSLTVLDAYAWQNRLGQVRYDAVLGGHTLAGLQAWGSRYTLRHDYEVVDSLSLVLRDGAARLSERATTPIRDGNEIRTLALTGSLDHARGRHRIQAGAEVMHTRSAFDLYSVRFPLVRSESGFLGGVAYSDGSRYGPLRRSVRHAADAWRLAAYADDVWAPAAHVQVEAGLRLTYLPDRATAYAEPRLGVRYERTGGPLGPWSMRTAAGLYRQFTAQMDASLLNVGALLPSVRVWLPLDPSVRPPLTYHFAHALRFRPAPRWRLRLEGYYKHQPHGLALRYAPAGAEGYDGLARAQATFLTRTRGHAYGGTMAIEWKHERTRLHALYEYAQARRRSPDLFEGRTETVPWNEPHRAVLGLDWRPTAHLTLSARARGIWGRAWGFRRAYYDYFGHADTTRLQGHYNLGRPSEHVLPAFYGLDLSLAYALLLGRVAFQIRLDVLNATGRRNVADWRLAYGEGAWYTQPRRLYGRIPALAVRLGF